MGVVPSAEWIAASRRNHPRPCHDVSTIDDDDDARGRVCGDARGRACGDARGRVCGDARGRVGVWRARVQAARIPLVVELVRFAAAAPAADDDADNDPGDQRPSS